jgi:hypothetical protein
MPETIGGMCIAIVVLGTIYSSFGTGWSTLGKRLYWVVGLILAYSLIETIRDMYPLITN